mmetsp:Transcript_43749/g.76755  ORF Transcript_43749/g.76755 Transcript_43749/m.76755 type:complete len:340 (+) Transcript_43749:1472-2491(+)
MANRFQAAKNLHGLRSSLLELPQQSNCLWHAPCRDPVRIAKLKLRSAARRRIVNCLRAQGICFQAICSPAKHLFSTKARPALVLLETAKCLKKLVPPLAELPHPCCRVACFRTVGKKKPVNIDREVELERLIDLDLNFLLLVVDHPLQLERQQLGQPLDPKTGACCRLGATCSSVIDLSTIGGLPRTVQILVSHIQENLQEFVLLLTHHKTALVFWADCWHPLRHRIHCRWNSSRRNFGQLKPRRHHLRCGWRHTLSNRRLQGSRGCPLRVRTAASHCAINSSALATCCTYVTVAVRQQLDLLTKEEGLEQGGLSDFLRIILGLLCSCSHWGHRSCSHG